MGRQKNISVDRSSLKKDLEKELECVRLIDKLVNKGWRNYNKEEEVGVYFLELTNLNIESINLILDYIAIYCSNCSNYNNPIHLDRFQYISPLTTKYDNIVCEWCKSFRKCEMCHLFKHPSDGEEKLLCKKCSDIYTEETAKAHKWLVDYSRKVKNGEISEDDSSGN